MDLGSGWQTATLDALGCRYCFPSSLSKLTLPAAYGDALAGGESMGVHRVGQWGSIRGRVMGQHHKVVCISITAILDVRNGRFQRNSRRCVCKRRLQLAQPWEAGDFRAGGGDAVNIGGIFHNIYLHHTSPSYVYYAKTLVSQGKRISTPVPYLNMCPNRR